MFSQTTEYALRVAVALAQSHDRALTADALAQQTRIPRGYLYKVLQKLARGGVVQPLRGVQGGYRLSGSPSEVTVLRVVDAVEPIPRIRTCPLDLPEHGCELCPLHRCLDEAMAGVERALASVALADLVQPAEPARPQCPGPGALADDVGCADHASSPRSSSGEAVGEP